MTYLSIALLIYFFSGLFATIFAAKKKFSNLLIIFANLVATLFLFAEIAEVFTAESGTSIKLSLYLLTGKATFFADALSALFIIPIAVLVPLITLYGTGYLSHSKQVGAGHWFFFNLLVASMVMVFTSANALLFLMFWELMTIAAFMLILHEDYLHSVKAAAWNFFAASHVATGFMLVFFAFMSYKAGSFEFSDFTFTGLPYYQLLALFIFSLIAFGTKAGFFPLHVWLPEAHPAAPTHVSALMSGIMIKTGAYSILRFWLTPCIISETIGWILLTGGAIGGIIAIIHALGQRDIKRILAYSSIENSGIIFIGIGAGILTREWNLPVASTCAFAGAMMHVLNHSLFKSLLFLGAGSVYFSTDTRNIESMGGLIKKLPITALSFIVGAIAISALPPLNGFMSEFLIYLSGIKAATISSGRAITLSVSMLSALGIIGGFAAACFVRIIGIAFCGEPRNNKIQANHIPYSMKFPMAIIAFSCLLTALISPWIFAAITMKFSALLNISVSTDLILPITEMMIKISVIFIATIMLTGLLMTIFKKIFKKPERFDLPTWGCGYAAPTPRMQYTASSFSQPLLENFSPIVLCTTKTEPIQDFLPLSSRFICESPDIVTTQFYAPLLKRLDNMLTPLRAIQHGKLHAYIAYIALTLLILIIWKVGLA